MAEEEKKRNWVPWVIIGTLGFFALRSLRYASHTSLKGCNKKREDLTYAKNFYGEVADVIQAAVWYYFDGMAEDDPVIGDALQMMNTDDDVKELICVYGIRGQEGYLTGHILPKYNLVATVAQYLDDYEKKDVNKVYQQKGITFRWL